MIIQGRKNKNILISGGGAFIWHLRVEQPIGVKSKFDSVNLWNSVFMIQGQWKLLRKI